ncbi:MAG: hypothetical protein GYA15_10590 [Leptolinea sp.]|jgi:hypothetical protein|nr:hypothetical protein [Leptolinea sp.]
MTFVIRDAQGCIKTFMEISAGVMLDAGDTLEEVPVPFGAYASRLRLLADGCVGELVKVPAGSGTIEVRVECPGETSVALAINGLEETVPLVDGKGALALSRETPGVFLIKPVDRRKYCAAGEALCVVEVTA